MLFRIPPYNWEQSKSSLIKSLFYNQVDNKVSKKTLLIFHYFLSLGLFTTVTVSGKATATAEDSHPKGK
jgi:hypothetical protein